jgi:hypothetical protein
MAIGLGISAISSGVNLISGLSRKNKAQKALKNFKRQELNNITEGMRVSTLGAEMQTREAQRRFSTSVDALRSGGVRALVGGLGKQEQLQQAQQQMISADLDRQQQQIDVMRAQDEARIRNMIETRETSAIAGLGREISEGRNQAQQGAFGLAQTAFAGAAAQKAGLFGSGGSGGSGGGSAADPSFSTVANTGQSTSNSLIDSSPTRFGISPSGSQMDLEALITRKPSSLLDPAGKMSQLYNSRLGGLTSAGAPQVAFSGPTGYNMEHAGFVKQ